MLTFGIPTYNGLKYISEAIESIYRQKIDCEFEVVIADNASTEDIASFIKGIDKKNLSYYRHEKNQGYDFNVDFLFKKAKGKYLWLLGDDDYISLDGVEQFLNAIADKNIDVINFPVNYLNISTGVLAPGQREKQLNSGELKGDDFFSQTLWMTSAMSSLVIRRESWLQANLQKYMGSQWIHLGALIEILKFGQGMIIYSPLVTVRIANPRWSENGNQLLLGLKHLELLEHLNDEFYKKETFENFVKARFKNNHTDILKLKSNSFKVNLFCFRMMRKFFHKKLRFWFLDLLLLLFVPNLKKTYNNLRRIAFK